MALETKLDFAYKYPFSREAKEVVAERGATSVEPNYLQEGVSQLQSAFKHGRITKENVKGLAGIKFKYIMGYAYARMLVSAIGDGYAISRFASAEAEAASDHLALSIDDLLRVADELGLGIRREQKEFVLSFENYVSVPKKENGMRLINQMLEKGKVHVNEQQLLKLVKGAIEKNVSANLPIDRKDLPKEIIDAARVLKPQERKLAVGAGSGSYAWIDKLLANPIPDVRHRTVNLILAPYLVNVKMLDEGSAAKVIIDFIERCKVLNPDTKVNETYIKYQCRYSKRKGMRPLSLKRAKELLKEVAVFE